MKRSLDYPLASRPIMGFSDEYAGGFVDPFHSHPRSQLSYAAAGVMSVVTETNSFMLPPQRAIWIPAGIKHEVHCRNPVSSYTLYIDPALDRQPTQCRVFEVSDLVKALIFEVGHFPTSYDLEGREGRIARLLLEEIERMPSTPGELTMPRDPRLLRVCRALLDDPADQHDIDHWARVAGMGRRTFTRLFRQETGAGLAVWRQHVRLMAAISRLAIGQPITMVAFDVGYESPSAFTAMFHRVFGMPPSAYLAQTQQRTDESAAHGKASEPFRVAAKRPLKTKTGPLDEPRAIAG
ncbi:AraC family transcriptional regulator [Sphingobium subterraneum]|uniref:AraC-like DNA-binding protein n=1 Tax=Sphingobium subterraneum TaxID=627688 RepID=A0A841IZ96_9SPHN|nr:helix-turn-helix transcriptional regulator [Sphingobium subterraneum]MBB6123734.1 AraC-like DNA-binding protein [Sphingobium subterraneum]